MTSSAYDRRIRRFFAWVLLAWLFLLGTAAIAFSQTADTCVVTGRILLQNGRPAAYMPFTLKSTALRYTGGPLLARQKINDTTDADGNLRFVAMRNSVINITSDVFGASVGMNLVIPDAPTASLESLVPTQTIPAVSFVAASLLRVGKTTLFPSDSLVFAGSGVTVTNLFGTTTVTVASGGATAVSDSLDANARTYTRRQEVSDSLALRVKALCDSLLALRGQAAALYAAISDLGLKLAKTDTAYGNSHTIVQGQRATHAGSAASPTFDFRPSTVTNHSVVPFVIWATDTTIVPWSLKVIHNAAVDVPNDNGYYGESMTLGLNSDAAWGTGPRKWGGWLKMGEYFWHGYSAPPDGPIQETHFEYLGENFPTTPIKRSLTWYNYISDGGGRQIEFSFFNHSFNNGSGSAPASDDSTAMRIGAPRSLGAVYTPGTIDFFKSSLRFNTTAAGSAYGAKIQIQRMDSAGLGYAGTYGIANVGGDVTYFGAPPSTAATAAAYPLFTEIGARHTKLHFDALFSRATFTGMQHVRLPARFATVGTDSALGTDATGDIKKVALPAAGVSASALKDSLDANGVRPASLTGALALKLSIAAPISVSNADSMRVVIWNATAGRFELAWKGGGGGGVTLAQVTDTLSLNFPRAATAIAAGDSALTVGSGTNKKGVHIHGGIRAEGLLTTNNTGYGQVWNHEGTSPGDFSGTYGAPYTATKTMMYMARYSSGGPYVSGFSGADGTPGYTIMGHVAAAAVTSMGAVNIQGWKQSGTSRAAMTVADKILDVGTNAASVLTVYGTGTVGGTSLLRGIATIGANDSVDVTVAGILPGDAVTLTYRIGKTTTGTETMLSYNVTAADRLTIFGVATRSVAYHRIK